MKIKFVKLIKLFDIFGRPITFEENGSQKLKTTLGGLLTMILIFIMIFIAMLNKLS